jgi:thiamine transport system substrate-binding protein
MKKFSLLILSIIVLTAGACAQKPDSEETRTLTVMTHDSFAVSESVVASFEEQYDVQVQFLEVGDTIDPVFQLDEGYRALPVDFGDVCLNYQKAYFEENKLAPPDSLEDLIDPAYKGLLTVENPATSSPGLAFLLTTIGHFGEDGYLDYWLALVKNEVNIVNDWETAYYAEFSQAGGPDPIVVSYGSSPPFEVLFAEEPLDDAPTAAVTSAGSCFRQIEFVGILKGTKNRDLAEKWVDFMLSPEFQEDIPLNMYVFPVNRNAVLDETFQK